MAKKTETRSSTAHINPFGLRMQPELRERLEAAAATEGRSLNAEIVARLEESFELEQEVVELEKVTEAFERSQELLTDSVKRFEAKVEQMLSLLPKADKESVENSLLIPRAKAK
ncbi:TPA: Arc family DNA-binding protein [Stenotrophomonas maltophilia]|uniref:Arc family DNA-binding protein n=1 Tax=Stenotrophomonas maltophilia TaxID=40324 RepID=UPI00066B46CD|nr:Arc family DNA-binding protein [Stenotrophomonas maltophilia]MBH1676127.1 Arc family DNA-binding protein [Stenotrophomonas maltophilia]HEL3212201.1 Arc family DNA-binding protein [Stenotrophomonas maltophilia]